MLHDLEQDLQKMSPQITASQNSWLIGRGRLEFYAGSFGT